MKTKLIIIFVYTLLISNYNPMIKQNTKDFKIKYTDEVIGSLSNNDSWMKTFCFNIINGVSFKITC